MEKNTGKDDINSSSPREHFRVVSGNDDENHPIFSVLVKRTYDIRPGKAVVFNPDPMPLLETDRYHEHGDAQSGTVRFESDLAPFKIATDVVFIGDAHVPEANPVTHMDATIEVDGHGKTIRVIGDRTCRFHENKNPEFTDPEPFTRMPIRYELAYGGWDRSSDPELPFAYPRNPMGTGLAIRNVRETIEGLRLPNLEDPEDLLRPEMIVLEDVSRWNRQPIPQSFGWFHKAWYPRCSHVGSFPGYVDVDEVMREEKSRQVPERQAALARKFKLPSFDIRFNNGASPGMALGPLTGNEKITLINLSPDFARLEFDLPGDPPKIVMDIGLGESNLEPVLHTVCVRSDQMQVDMLWRGAHRYPGVDWLEKMKKMDVRVER